MAGSNVRRACLGATERVLLPATLSIPMVTALRSKDMEFDGKVAIVTGAASGIRQAIAAYLAENGATVAIANQMED